MVSPIVKSMTVILVVISVVIALFTASEIVETNDSGYMQVKQAAVSGDMSVMLEPGMYLQMFADVTTYKVSDVYDFDREPITVRFNDAATATITGQIKFKLPMVDTKVLKLHQDFRSYDAVTHDLVRQVVAASLKQSATHFGAEEVYSTRRSDFIELVNNQIKEGMYATTYTENVVKDSDGNVKVKRNVKVAKDANGFPIINEISAFNWEYS